MKRTLLLLIFVACLPAAEPADESKKDLDKLQGEWIMAALEVDGTPVPEAKLAGSVLTIKGDKYIVATKKTTTEVTFKLDAAQKPKAIDMFFPDGTNLPKVGKGIYKIEGDTFVMCRAQATENPRPTEFATTANTGYFVVTWKRKK